MKYILFFIIVFTVAAGIFAFSPVNGRTIITGLVLFKNVTLIDGNGGAPVPHTDVLVEGNSIKAVGHNLGRVAGAQEIDLSGKTMMPSLMSTHVHIGTLKDTGNSIENYTRNNILSQLKKYQNYGVGNVLVMGTDQPMLFESGLRDSSAAGLLPGARIHSAGYGFTVPGGPPAGNYMDRLFRPADPSEVPAQMDKLALLKPDVVKIWVDDFGGSAGKMEPAVYKTIIIEAHKHGLRVAAHVYYLADARQLVAAGIDIFAHSVRDSVIDDALVQQMKEKHVIYIPTLSLDEFAYIYARGPEWLKDDFFKASLEPGVYEKISSPEYRDAVLRSPAYAKNAAAFETALKNVKKLHAAGILICLGTDSGAQPLRTQGFSEHLELQLLVQAGLTTLQAIGAATKNGAELLRIDKNFGTIEKGKTADLVILSDNPAADIKSTRKIEAVYKAGKLVSKGPL